MSTLQAIVLGLVQGITEFLPISSTAHLILVPHLLGWDDPGLRFAIWTNAATLLAVVAYFRDDLLGVMRDLVRGQVRLVALLVVATIPVVVEGLVAYRWLSSTGRSPALIGVTSIVFGVLLAWADRRGARSRSFESIGWRDAWIFGLAEGLALIPGTSRSGVTMTAGLALGLDRTSAARFSLLMAIPVGTLALAKDLFDMIGEANAAGTATTSVTSSAAVSGAPVAWLPLLLGVVVSGLSAYWAIGWLIRWLEKQSLQMFVVYRVALGLVLLGWAFTR